MSEALDYGDDNYAPESADGTLVILVCRAKHLPNRRKLDKQSPYVTLRIGTTAKKTPSHFRSGQTPEWTHEIRFQLTRERKPIMKLDILDETKHDPTPIGSVDIDCSVIFGPDHKKVETDSQGKKLEKYIHDSWYDLKLNDKRAGKIYLEMTFYPQVPVVPPKINLPMYGSNGVGNDFSHVSSHGSYYHDGASPHHGVDFAIPAAKSYPPPPRHPSHSKSYTAADEVFVSSDNSDDRARKLSAMFKHSANGSNNVDVPPSKSTPNVNDSQEVFVSNPGSPSKFKNYTDKFSKLTKKFTSREPITTLLVPQAPANSSAPNLIGSSPKHSPGTIQQPRSRSISPLSEYGRDDEPRFGHIQGGSSGGLVDDENRSPYSDYQYHSNNDELELAPPIPPPHLVDNSRSTPSPPPVPADHHKKKSPQRKPPPSFSSNTLSHQLNNLSLNELPSLPASSIPFSADNFGLEDSDEDDEGDFFKPPVPTKATNSPDRKGDMDPRYFAPAPTEHFNRVSRLQHGNARTSDVSVDYRTDETGYLGEGRWDQVQGYKSPEMRSQPDHEKFSPSVFDRMPLGGSNKVNVERKPNVPPKIPQGMSEMEYYVLEKEKFLKDINGNRI